MKHFNFDEIVNRRGTRSYKWDSAARDGVLPMWVADMDFRTAPVVIDALRRRVEHGVFGYTLVPDDYYDAIIRWFSSRHGWTIERSQITYTSGVVPAISAIIKALSKPGSKVLVQTPVYNCFFSSIRNNGCQIADSPLVYANNYYTIDFADLEHRMSDPDVNLMLLCNPHNPAGRVWSSDELRKIARLASTNGVTVVSDEIHCELVFPGFKYTPYAAVAEGFSGDYVVCCSPTKAFNIAGLQIANTVCRSGETRAKVDKAININEVCDVNPFGIEALIAAYNHGGEWLEELKAYLYDNYIALCNFFRENLPQLGVTRMEGTYLVWVDCSALGMKSEEMEERLLESESLWLNCGVMYGTEGFMRINIACPRKVMLDGLNRLKRFVDSLKA